MVKQVSVNRTGKRTERKFEDGTIEVTGTVSGKPQRSPEQLRQIAQAQEFRQREIQAGAQLTKEEIGRQVVMGLTPQDIQERNLAEAQTKQQEIAQAPVDVAREIPRAELTEKGVPTELEEEKTKLFRRIRKGEASPDEIKTATERFDLNDVDLEVIKSGEADVSKMGQLIETLPFIPRELKKFVPAFSSPSKKVTDIQATLVKTNDNINLWSDLAASNPQTASRYIKLIKDAEKEVLRMESRIKIMTIQSPDLQANPEQITLIEASITEIKTTAQEKREMLMLLGLR